MEVNEENVVQIDSDTDVAKDDDARQSVRADFPNTDGPQMAVVTLQNVYGDLDDDDDEQHHIDDDDD